MSKLNLEEKLEAAMDSFNGAMNSVLIILEEKQKLKKEKQELLEAAKDITPQLELFCEQNDLADFENYKKLRKTIQKVEGDMEVKNGGCK